MGHTLIPPEELDVFTKLEDIQVVVDVGARADTDYMRLKPHIELHAFEPHPEFFLELKEAMGERENVYLNDYGLGDEEGDFPYNDGVQGFVGGEAPVSEGARMLTVKTLDWYIQEKGITRIDFLKIDVEGYDFKVLLGGKKALKMTKYLQYEHWDDKEQFHKLLEKDFDMEYVGYRNVLCMSKKLVPKKTRSALSGYLKVMGYRHLA